jgi:hypothetical protein
MALIKCPECEKEISSKAKTCPHCGCPLEKKEDNKSKVPKKRFHSKEYKMTGIILSIPCSLILLIFLLGITFNNIIPSVILAGIYGLIIYFMSKFMLNTKPHIKKYLWVVIVVIVIPLLITFILLFQNQDFYFKNDVHENEVGINKIGGCHYYYKSSMKEIKAINCSYEKLNEGNANYLLKVKAKDGKTYNIQCYELDTKPACSNPLKPVDDKFINLNKK